MTPDQIISGHSHSFDSGIARELGINAAIVYNHIIYWIRINAHKKDAEMIEGKYWMYETQKEMSDFLDYMSFEEVKKAVVKLLDAGLLIKGNYNKNPFDRTAWYTVPDQKIIKKTLTKAPCGAMHETELAPSESAIGRHVYNTIEQQEKHQYEKPAAGGAEVSHSLIFKNTKGEASKVLESDVYSYFLKLPYSTEEIQQAIAQVKESNDFIGNIFKYLEAICLRIHNSKLLKPSNLSKNSDCGIPDKSNQPRVNLGQMIKQKQDKNETEQISRDGLRTKECVSSKDRLKP